MTSSDTTIRALATYAVVLPLAILLGFISGSGVDWQFLTVVGMVLFVLATPLLMKWNHPLLFLTYNSSAVAFFLPGKPELWLVMAYGSFAMLIVEKSLVREKQFLPARSVLLPLLLMGLIVLVTGQLTGGFSAQIFGGSTFGGRRYFDMFGAIAAFLVIIAVRIPDQRIKLYIILFFLGGLANVITSIIPALPPSLWILANLFPVTTNDLGAITGDLDFGGPQSIGRFLGFGLAGEAGVCFLLAMHGIRESLDRGKFLRLLLLLAVVAGGTLGGFRGYLVLVAMIILLVAFFEGVFRSRLLLPIIGFAVLLIIGLVMFSDQLPLSVQRTISVLPFKINPVARYEAQGSSEWRVNLWKAVWPEVPQYFWLGKGLSIQGRDLEIEERLTRMKGVNFAHQVQLLSGDYHSGPLTLIIPFGIWGVLAWIWFLWASIRALYLNHLHGSESLRKINTLLLAIFIAKPLNFLFIFGNVWSDFAGFVGLVAFSIALNGGILKPVRTAVEAARPAPIAYRLRAATENSNTA